MADDGPSLGGTPGNPTLGGETHGHPTLGGGTHGKPLGGGTHGKPHGGETHGKPLGGGTHGKPLGGGTHGRNLQKDGGGGTERKTIPEDHRLLHDGEDPQRNDADGVNEAMVTSQNQSRVWPQNSNFQRNAGPSHAWSQNGHFQQDADPARVRIQSNFFRKNLADGIDRKSMPDPRCFHGVGNPQKVGSDNARRSTAPAHARFSGGNCGRNLESDSIKGIGQGTMPNHSASQRVGNPRKADGLRSSNEMVSGIEYDRSEDAAVKPSQGDQIDTVHCTGAINGIVFAVPAWNNGTPTDHSRSTSETRCNSVTEEESQPDDSAVLLSSASSVSCQDDGTTPAKKRSRPGRAERNKKRRRKNASQPSTPVANAAMEKLHGAGAASPMKKQGTDKLPHVKLELPEEEDETGREAQVQRNDLDDQVTGIARADVDNRVAGLAIVVTGITANIKKELPSDCDAVAEAPDGGKARESPARCLPLEAGAPYVPCTNSDSRSEKSEENGLQVGYCSAKGRSGLSTSGSEQDLDLLNLLDKVLQGRESRSGPTAVPSQSVKVQEPSVDMPTSRSLQQKNHRNFHDRDGGAGRPNFVKEEEDRRVIVSASPHVSGSTTPEVMQREQACGSPSPNQKSGGRQVPESRAALAKNIAALNCNKQLVIEQQHRHCQSQVSVCANHGTSSDAAFGCAAVRPLRVCSPKSPTAVNCGEQHSGWQFRPPVPVFPTHETPADGTCGPRQVYSPPKPPSNPGDAFVSTPHHGKVHEAVTTPLAQRQMGGGGSPHGKPNTQTFPPGSRPGCPPGKGGGCAVQTNAKGGKKQEGGAKCHVSQQPESGAGPSGKQGGGVKGHVSQQPELGAGPSGVRSPLGGSKQGEVIEDSKQLCTKLMEQLFSVIERRERTVSIREKALGGDMIWLLSEAKRVGEEKTEVENSTKKSLLLRDEAREERRRCQSEADRAQSKAEQLEKLVTEHSILLTEVNQKQSMLKTAQEELELKEKRLADLEQLLLAREKKLARRERTVLRLHQQLLLREKELLPKGSVTESGQEEEPPLSCEGRLPARGELVAAEAHVKVEANSAPAMPGPGEFMDGVENCSAALASRQRAVEPTDAGVDVQHSREGGSTPKAAEGEGRESGGNAAGVGQCVDAVKHLKVPKQEPVDYHDGTHLQEIWPGSGPEAWCGGDPRFNGSTYAEIDSAAGQCRETPGSLECVKMEVDWNALGCARDDHAARGVKEKCDGANGFGSQLRHAWVKEEDEDSTEGEDDGDNLVDVPLWHIVRARKKEAGAAAVAQVQKNDVMAEEKKLVVVSVEEALRKDAPDLLESLTERGLILEGLQLYEEGADHGREFHELQKVLTKLWAMDGASDGPPLPTMQVPNAVATTKLGKYCLDCLIALIEQTQYMKKRGLDVSWGWCRRLHSFLFVFQKHNRIVLERPEYGCATYFFEIAHPAPIEWQIQRLISVLSVSNVGRTALLENRPLEVGKDLTKEDAEMLEGFGWAPNSGLGSLLNFCDRVVHLKGVREESKDWRRQIGEKLMAGYAQGGIPQQHGIGKHEAMDEEEAGMCNAVAVC
ncbi:hypothetical protein CBR_g12792 [Chara braunii]|uniref:Uncharacterized protein n=1 Tax=Chara braunii TaxID=69332 RepID=A0A388KSQ6_CHABU|nr:hypothetical protein CBR_g12792 [Chara braunii]|eukprot:GBG73076.1 hypothetical protein CBR_g12792 [Chara braunii]